MVKLRDTASVTYYQPMRAKQSRRHSQLADGSRDQAHLRERDQEEVALATSIHVRIEESVVELTVDIAGPAADWALELAFRPGGVFSGVRSLGNHQWQLDAARPLTGQTVVGAPVPPASYRVEADRIEIAVVDASDGAGGPILPCAVRPRYEPGEEYSSVDGTDAAAGELLYVSARAPARLRLRLSADRLSTPEDGTSSRSAVERDPNPLR
jgi:hypothetical protein